ncbi:MAG TPA: TetR/AcrR family transcriptional regulator [Hyphomonadaceae bacterium]|nr:TetR/AcrR family transcriptional regulator [Hyphomonadaceae bacterium]
MPTKTAARSKRLGPGRLSAEETAELPNRLLDAAMTLFSERGYGETTMDQIAKAAGASTKTIYARYANKTDILKAVVRRLVDRTAQVHARTAPLGVDHVSPREYLVGLGVDVCMRIATDAAALNRFAMAEAYRTPEIRRLHMESTANGAKLIREGLEMWREQGLLPDLAPADFDRASVLALSMMTDWTRILTSLGAPPARAEIERHVEFAVDIFLRGCGYRPEAAASARRKPRKA